MNRETFEMATDHLLQQILDTLNEYVEEADDPKELVIVARVLDTGAEIRGVTLAEADASLRGSGTHREIVDKLRATAREGHIPILFLRNEPTGVLVVTGHAVYQPGGFTGKGGEA